MCTSGVRRDLCTDLMESWSWILTICSVTTLDLCSPPARITVLGVSHFVDLFLFSVFSVLSMFAKLSPCSPNLVHVLSSGMAGFHILFFVFISLPFHISIFSAASGCDCGADTIITNFILSSPGSPNTPLPQD